MVNQAFVDGQNLHLGTTKSRPKWKIDLRKLRTYLAKKYDVGEAYYFLGCVDTSLQDLYDDLQKAGFILVFRKHNSSMLSVKKGNVDTDIVFTIMKKLCKNEIKGSVFLVSSDGDYYKLVHFLIGEKKLGRILFPSRKSASSLYKNLEPKYFDALDAPGVKKKIAYKTT